MSGNYEKIFQKLEHLKLCALLIDN